MYLSNLDFIDRLSLFRGALAVIGMSIIFLGLYLALEQKSFAEAEKELKIKQLKTELSELCNSNVKRKNR